MTFWLDERQARNCTEWTCSMTLALESWYKVAQHPNQVGDRFKVKWLHDWVWKELAHEAWTECRRTMRMKLSMCPTQWQVCSHRWLAKCQNEISSSYVSLKWGKLLPIGSRLRIDNHRQLGSNQPQSNKSATLIRIKLWMSDHKFQRNHHCNPLCQIGVNSNHREQRSTSFHLWTIGA